MKTFDSILRLSLKSGSRELDLRTSLSSFLHPFPHAPILVQSIEHLSTRSPCSFNPISDEKKISGVRGKF